MVCRLRDGAEAEKNCYRLLKPEAQCSINVRMRVFLLAILCLAFLSIFCCGCNVLYQLALFNHWVGHDEDDVDAPPFIGAWTDVALMSDSRAAVCDAIGTKIYVCGGEGATGALDTVVVYDTEADTWTPLSSLPAPTSGHVCVALDDKVYVFGGLGVSSVYDPASDLWTPVSAPQATSCAAAAVCGDKIYYFGGALPSGYTSSTTQIYDPLLDSWSLGATMPESRAGAFCQEVGGRVYVIGGYHNPPGGPIDSYTDTVFEYDPVADSWAVRTSSLTHPRAYGCCAVVGEKIVIIGGFDGNYPGLEYVEAYNPASNSCWLLRKEPSARSFVCGAAVGTRVYVIGGKIGPASYTALTREFISP